MSDTINNGGPAFPTENEAQTGTSTWRYEGMTLRDYFAAKAMQALVSDHRRINRDDIALAAYDIADAMLRARGNV